MVLDKNLLYQQYLHQHLLLLMPLQLPHPPMISLRREEVICLTVRV